MNRAMLAVLLGIVFLNCASVHADDGGITFGGSPRLLAGNKTVALQREVVRMSVGEDNVTVDCQFVFVNHGPACTVRMGFPDSGRGGDSGQFTSFHSYVDGKPVPVKFVKGAKDGEGATDDWHAKTVSFAANGTRHVHDIYTVPVGGQVIDKGDLSQTFYILHTGSSWRGPIGRADIYVTFHRKSMTGRILPLPLSAVNNDAFAHNWSHEKPGRVVYRGPSIPTVSGKTLHFVRTNFRPGYNDDVLLYFDNRRFN